MRGLLECSYDKDYWFYCYVRMNSLSDFPSLDFALATTTLSVPPEDFVVLVFLGIFYIFL